MAFKMRCLNFGQGTVSMMNNPNLKPDEASMYNKNKDSMYNKNKDSMYNKNKDSMYNKNKDSMYKKNDPYADALKRDPKLPEYIKKRKTLEKGSAEWNANQNRINKAYGKGPMRDQTTEVKKENDRKTVTVTDTPGVSTVTEKEKDNKKKTTTVDHQAGTVTKDKVKAGKDGELGTDDDKKKTKTRKKFAETKFGKSKLGQKLVSKKNKKGGMNSATVNA